MNLTKHQVDALNNCLKCSICVDNCPVAGVNPEFPGPKQLGVDWLRIAQENGRQISGSVAYCSNCKNCETVCSSGVLIGTLNQLAKSDLPKSGLGLRDIIFADPARLGRIIHIWPQAGNCLTGLKPVKYLMEKTVGISAKATMPAYSDKTLRNMLKDYHPFFEKEPKEVLYFPGCFAMYNKPEIGLSLVKLLTKLNYKVIVPDFKCCGQPAISNARLQDTRKFAGRNLKLSQQLHQPGMPILFTCPSCLLTFKDEYQNILGLQESASYSSYLYDAGQFLLNHQDRLAALLNNKAKTYRKMAYHEPCHLRAAGQGTPGLTLLNQLTAYEITPLEAGCCGAAGSYGLKAEKQWIADKIGNHVKTAIDKLTPEVVITECGMCSVQINNLTKLPVYHPVELLAEFIGD